MRSNKMRKAFSMLELALALVVIGIVYLGILEATKNMNETRNVYSELALYQNIEAATKESFISILDSFEPVCSVVPSDASTTWGWKANECKKTSPFPTYHSASRKLTYAIQFDSLSAAEKVRLENEIVGSYNGVCKKDSSNNSKLVLLCPKIKNVQYDLGAGLTGSAHTVGTTLAPDIVPNVRVVYERISMLGNIAPQDVDYDFTMNDVYTFRRNYSLNKMNQIRDSITRFHKAKLLAEIQNSPTGGIHSMDDEFVPWFWEVFGDNASPVTIASTTCVQTADSCTNLTSSQVWRGTVSGRGLYLRRIIKNLMAGDVRYAVDGFNNQVSFYPLAKQCTGTNFATCSVAAPALPANNYITSATNPPPFVSVLYVDGYGAKANTYPPYARMYISY